MLKLLEEARVRAFWRAGGGARRAVDRRARSPATRAAALLTLIARQEIVYLQPVPYGQRSARCADVVRQGRRLQPRGLLRDLQSRRGTRPQVVYARAFTVVVKVDTETGRPTRWGEAERAAWAQYLDEPIRVRPGGADRSAVRRRPVPATRITTSCATLANSSRRGSTGARSRAPGRCWRSGTPARRAATRPPAPDGATTGRVEAGELEPRVRPGLPVRPQDRLLDGDVGHVGEHGAVERRVVADRPPHADPQRRCGTALGVGLR